MFRFQNGGDLDFFSFEVDLASNGQVVFRSQNGGDLEFLFLRGSVLAKV